MAKSKKIIFEYPMHSSKHILFEYVTVADKLKEWFAQEIICEGGEYTFIWEDSTRKAFVHHFRENRYVRYKWKESNEFLEFRIDVDEITGDVVLIIIDFLDDSTDKAELERIWDSQIAILHEIIGA